MTRGVVSFAVAASPAALASLIALGASLGLADAPAPPPGRVAAPPLPEVRQDGGRCDELAPGAPRPPLVVRASAAGASAVRLRVEGFLHPCAPVPSIEARWSSSAPGWLELGVREAPPGVASRCDCAHALVLRLRGLPPGEVRVRVTDAAGRTARATALIR